MTGATPEVAWGATAPCPQCGARTELEVGDPLLSCAFCKTTLYAVSRGPLGYRLPVDPAWAERTIFHLPYWRMRGLRYTVDPATFKVDAHLFDATAAATSFLPPGANLGVRPQAGVLTLSDPPAGTIESDTAPSRVSDACVLDRLLNQRPPLFSQLIGEQLVMIYAPFTLTHDQGRSFLQEAFPGGAAHPLETGRAEALIEAVGMAGGAERLTFLPMVCPNCAHDLPARRGAQVLVCPHCALAWWPHGGRFRKMPYAVLGGRRRGDRLIPFWEITFTLEEAGLRSRADLNRMMIPYRLVRPEWEEDVCALLVPGIKLPGRTFLRLGKTATLFFTGDHGPPRPETGRVETEPVRMPLSEAVEAMPLILTEMAMNKRVNVPAIVDGEVKLTRARLLYIPFGFNGREWHHAQSGQSISDTVLARGANL